MDFSGCDLSWLTTYDRKAGIKRVAEKLCVTEEEAGIQIREVEKNLVLVQDDEGKKRLKNAFNTSHVNLMGRLYRRQQHPTCCGVASLAIGLDVLQQKNTLKDKVAFTMESDIFNMVKVLDENRVKQRGMTLQTLANACEELFSSRKLRVIKHKPEMVGALRQILLEHFSRHDDCVLLCNYSMPIAGQGNWWGGHISPVAAFDKSTDSVLIMDVWKFTDPFWIDLETLHNATVLSIDPDSNDSRGFVQIIS